MNGAPEYRLVIPFQSGEDAERAQRLLRRHYWLIQTSAGPAIALACNRAYLQVPFEVPDEEGGE